MERDKPAEDPTVTQADADANDDTVDHQRLARLLARSEQIESSPLFAPSLSPPRSAEAPRNKSSLAIIMAAAIVGFVVLVGGLVGYFFMYKSPTKSSITPGVSPSNSPNPMGNNPPPTWTKPELIAVPGGTFHMGRTGGPVQEGPPHPVTVASFAMDNTEVTNAEYADFVRDTGYAPPNHWGGNSPVGHQEHLPVVNVSIEDAKAFAAWRSKRDGVTYRLPTEEEWEYAARGGEQGNLYPWGNSWIAGRAATRDAGLASLKPVGSYPDGKARWGHLDMIGNVWEWTSSKPSFYQGSDLTVPPAQENWSIIRGGSLKSDPLGEKAITNAYRDWIEPTIKNELLGFRLVRENKQ